jgi:hypothetical protein
MYQALALMRTSTRVQELAEERQIPGDLISLGVDVLSGATSLRMGCVPGDLYNYVVTFDAVLSYPGFDHQYGEDYTRLVKAACEQHAQMLAEAMVGEELGGVRLKVVKCLTRV